VKVYRNAVADLADLDAIIADPATEPDLRGVAPRRTFVEARRVALAHDIRLALIPRTPWTTRTSFWRSARHRGDEASLFPGPVSDV